MKIEAIISHRNELLSNIHRTYYNLRRHGVSVSLIDDNPAKGCGFRRDQGIMDSKADIVFLCDAHMHFSDGYFDHIRNHLARNGNDLTVSRMQSMDRDWRDIDGELYAGAEIMLCDSIPGNQYIPIAAKWRREDTGDGPIGAVMGACYAMRRDAYVAMGRPLAILRAWGCDEEMLSISCWLSGGKVQLIAGTAHHMYAAPKPGRGGLTHAEAVEIWANRLAMLSAIPMKPETSARLVAWLKQTAFVAANKDAINTALIDRLPDIQRVNDRLSESSMTLEQYLQEWGRAHASKNETEIKREQVRMVDDDERRQYVQSPVVVDGGLPCPHCGERFGHKISHTYPNGNRRRVCGNCAMPFVTIRVVDPER
jgi:hypothetical protein